VSEALLSVRGLRAWYGRAQVLSDIALDLARGEVIALMGRNGAGKSTTFRAIMGLMERSAGEVLFRGQALHGLEPFEIARLGLGYVPEDRRIFSELSVMENLEVGRQPARDGAPLWTPEKLFAIFPNLGEMRDRPGGRMSGGEQQMLTVARTLMGNPYLVMLDEPSEGIAPKIVEDMANMILELKREGLSVLLSEQNLHFAQLVCDRAYVIEKGQVRYEGTMAELARNAEVMREYLSL
jgi:branched-chain amino acid transport system ATP-binding protein